MAEKRKQYNYKIDKLPFTPLIEKENINTQFLLGDNVQIIFSPPRTGVNGHVERMQRYGTMPNEDGSYPELPHGSKGFF